MINCIRLLRESMAFWVLEAWVPPLSTTEWLWNLNRARSEPRWDGLSVRLGMGIL